MLFPVLRKNYILRRYEVGNLVKAAIYGIYNKKTIEINEDALFCIKHFSGEYSIEDIANEIAQRFNIENQKALYSVNKLVDELRANDIIYLNNKKSIGYRFSSLPKMRGALNHVYLLLTKTCNLRCRHCSFDAGIKAREELTKKEVFNPIDQIYEMMVPNLTISGGEPTLIEYLPELIEFIAKKPIKTHLMTNGFKIDRPFAELLVRSGLVHVNISLDGADESPHDYLRGMKGSFNAAVNAIRIFKEFGIYVETTTVIYEKNYNCVKEIIKLGKSLNVDNMKFVPIVPYKRGKNCDFITSLYCYINNIRNFLFDYGAVNNKIIRRDLTKIMDSGEAIYRCGAGTGIIAISPEGDVLPCNNIENIKLGNIRDKKLIEIYNKSDNIKKVLEKLSIKGSDCEQCDILDYCGGGCIALAYSYHGDFKKCDITRKPYIIELIKENKEIDT